MQSFLPHLLAALGDGRVVLFTALRVAAVYAVVLLLLRLTGKRVLGQLTPFDLVTLLLLSSAVQNAMIGPDVSLTGGLLAAVILLLCNRLLSRFRRLRESLEGKPTLLIHQGQVREQSLQQEGVSRSELEAALREHGVLGPEGVASAVLEMDGSISVVAMEHETLHRLHSVKSRHTHVRGLTR
jgi:uncharacterized membrane protein YcaP (DUF421 family)